MIFRQVFFGPLLLLVTGASAALADTMELPVSAASAGMGTQGITQTRSPSTAASNPASLAGIHGVAFSVGGPVGVRLTSAERPFMKLVERKGWAPSFRGAPSLAAAHGLGRMALGVSFASLLIQEDASGMKQQSWVVQPAMAYQGGSLSIGAGLAIVGMGWSAGPWTGLGAGVGARLGMRVEPMKQVAFGVAWRTRVLVPVIARAKDDWVAAPVELPDELTGGVALRPWPLTRMEIEAGWRAWPEVRSVHLLDLKDRRRRDDGTFSRGPYRNAGFLRGGVEQSLFWVLPDLKARAGGGIELPPEKNGNVPLWVHFSMGLGWRLFGVGVDAAYVLRAGVPKREMLRRAYMPPVDVTHLAVIAFSLEWRPPR